MTTSFHLEISQIKQSIINKKNNKVNITIYKNMQIAKKIRLIEPVDKKPIKYVDFYKLGSGQYFLNQIKDFKINNLKSDNMKENTTKRI